MLRRLARTGLASFVGFGRGIWLFPLDVTFKTVGLRYGWLRALFIGTPAPLLRAIGRLRAERAAWRATRRVPAYGAFLEASGVDVAGLFPFGVLGKLPETDKRRVRRPLRSPRPLRRRDSPLPRHDPRRIERLNGNALQLDPRSSRAGCRPPQHRVLRALCVRDRRRS